MRAAHVHHQIDHQLPWAVIGYLAATIGLHHLDIAGREQMLGAPRLALCEHRVVLGEPQLILRRSGALRGESLHGVQYGRVARATEIDARGARFHYRTRRTSEQVFSVACSSRNCTSDVARMVMVTAQ